ncbi:MAG: efflux RND transporter periplasmic adaptor subunit [Opitutales bacterium]|nr:efflux RND transporter periplasmic adaptor subunit [Opitutales bacterium]
MDRKIQKKKWTLKRVVMFGVMPALVIFAIYSIYSGSKHRKLSVKLERITIARVSEGSFQEFIPVRGNVLPINTLYLDSPEGGQVLEIMVEEGANVTKGQPLLRLENKELELVVRAREETVNSEINRLEEMKLNLQQNLLEQKQTISRLDFEIAGDKRRYERRAALWEDGLVPELEYIDAKASYEYNLERKELMIETHEQESELQQIRIQKQADIVKRMEKDMELIRSRLDTLVLRAPVDGQLTSFDAEVGESKSKGQRIGMIDVLDRLKVQANTDEHYLPRLQKNLRGTFELSDDAYELKVSKIYPEIEDGSVVFDLLFPDTIPGNLRRGQTLHIRLELGESDQAMMIPRGGFYQATGGNWVFVLDETGNQAVRRQIRLGRQNIENFEVLGGLKPGERVVTSSYDNYQDMDILIIN